MLLRKCRKRRKRRNRRLRLEFLLLIIPVLSVAFPMDSMESGNSFYDRKEEGWFWYRERLEQEKEEPKKIKSPAPGARMEGGNTPIFSTAWLKQNLPKYREIAIDNPTPENVAAYFALQRLAMDKAQKFARTFQMLPVLYPQLDENIRRPIATFASHAADRIANSGRDRVLRDLAQRVGIFFFFRSDCPYCHAQAPVIAILEKKYGFKIIPISIDGLPMPGGVYPNYRIDQGQAQKLGVTITPTMFLVNPEDEIEKIRLLSQGAVSLSDLETRIISVAHDAGWLDDEDYKKTLNFNPIYLQHEISGDFVGTPSPEEVLRILGVTHSPTKMDDEIEY